jgi:hypothetical protein
LKPNPPPASKAVSAQGALTFKIRALATGKL